MIHGNARRRAFLAAAARFGGLRAVGPLGLQCAALAALSSPSARASGDDYKALVCVNLLGGNDQLATLYDATPSSLAQLSRFRPGLVPARDALLPITPATAQPGRQPALHPELVRLRARFAAGQVAIVAGIGTLEHPLTRAQAEAGAPLPAGNGSHNDGNALWHTLGPDGTLYGWGGLMLDALASANGASPYGSVSVGFYNAFGSGRTVQQFHVSEDGYAMTIEGLEAADAARLGNVDHFGSTRFAADLQAWIGGTPSHLIEREYVRTYRRVMDGAAQLNAAFKATESFPRFFTGQADTVAFRDNRLGYELRSVARLIQQRQSLGVRRQVFFVDHFGYDNHGALVVDHGRRMRELDAALGYFDDVIGQLGLRDQVTVFTTTDFGRALIANGDGTGHGWGGVQFIQGGAVRGGDLYGALPSTDPASADYLPSSAQIPRFAVEQSVATLGRWLGVSDADLRSILPRWGRFSPATLGFMRA